MTRPTPRPRFRQGQRVRLTPAGLALRLQGRASCVGTVTSTPRDPRYVNVRRDGTTAAGHYAAEFWRPVRAEGGR